MQPTPARTALDQLIPEVYDQLRQFAARSLSQEASGISIQTTELVHEAFIRLSQLREIKFEREGDLMRAAVGVMRRVLIDHARAKLTKKRDKRLLIRTSSENHADTVPAEPILDLLALDEALEGLAKVDPRKAEIVELRYFGAQGNEQIAETLGISVATVKRDWTLARAWLHRELNDEASPAAEPPHP
jgi:RNA polymerase sigma factor (TIGR02999 family)